MTTQELFAAVKAGKLTLEEFQAQRNAQDFSVKLQPYLSGETPVLNFVFGGPGLGWRGKRNPPIELTAVAIDTLVANLDSIKAAVADYKAKHDDAVEPKPETARAHAAAD